MTGKHFNSVCVFCGSRLGNDARYQAAASDLGDELVRCGMTLVYGGGQVGLMGVIADAVLDAGGRVIGVIPEALATKELIHPGTTEMHVVPSMHARKAKMAELSDAFLALPGGFGTLEELLEVITWAQLGIHSKPTGVLNVAGFFDPLIQLIERGVKYDFIKPNHRELIVVHEEPAELLLRLLRHRLPKTRRWMEADES